MHLLLPAQRRIPVSPSGAESGKTFLSLHSANVEFQSQSLSLYLVFINFIYLSFISKHVAMSKCLLNVCFMYCPMI